jgi:DNA gyrase subunit B
MAKKRELNNEQQNAINNYSDSITHLETFAIACRKLPSMYLGTTGVRGVLNMNREIFQNIIDQIIMLRGIASRAIVSYSEIDKEFIYEDDGLSVPWDKLVNIFTSNHTSKNYVKDPFDFSCGVHGSGAKATCACSEYFIVESYKMGKGKMMRFECGVPMYKELKDIPNSTIFQGTRITFKVDESVMGEGVELPWEIMYDLFTTMISLTKIGTSMIFNCIPKNGQNTSTTFINEDGILYELMKKTDKPFIKPVMISKLDPSPEGKMAIDIAFTYDVNMGDEDISSFANWSPTVGGTHVSGFIDGICKFFRDYMNKIYLNSNKKNILSVINSDIKTGLKAMIHCRHLYPAMKGQSKEELNNEDVIPFIKQSMAEQLEEWAKTNPNDLQKLCGLLKTIAEDRVKHEKSKEKITMQYSSTKSVLDLPDKYKKPEARYKKGVKYEFWWVEGDSAGGSAVNARNPFQAIFPSRGKMPNAFTTTREKFLNNDEVQAYYGILGGGYGKKFDINKVKEMWEKIICGADGDVDGLHITTLFLQMNLLYSRELIEEGMLYRAVPPLFGVNKGTEKKPNMVYYTDSADYLKYIQSLFVKDNDIRTVKGSVINNKELEYIIHTNINYIYQLERIANTYQIDYQLLEDVVFASEGTYNQLYKVIKSKYKYMDIDKRRDTTIIKGLVGKSINTIYLNDQFMRELELIKNIIRKNQSVNFKVNGDILSLYQFMKLFDTYKSKVQRYKGLGEMNADQLGDSTLLPDNRTLVRYTIASAKEEIERIRYLESNKYELIQGQSTTRSGL